MRGSSLTEHGLRIVVAALVSLAVAPAALAEDGVPPTLDPTATAIALVDAAMSGMPSTDPLAAVAEVVGSLPPATTQPIDPVPSAAPEAVPAAAAKPNLAMEPHPSPPPAQPGVAVPVEPAPVGEIALVSDFDPLEAAPEGELAPAAEPQYQAEPAQYQPVETVQPEASSLPATSVAVEEPEQAWNWDWTWSCGGSKPVAQPPAIANDVLPKNWNWNWAWNCDPGKDVQDNKKQEYGVQYQPVNTRYHPLNVNVSIRIASPGDDGPVTQTNIVLAVDAGPVSATVQAAVPPPADVSSSDPAATAQAALTPPAAASSETKPDASRKTKLASPTDEPRTLLSAQPAATVEAPSWTGRPVVPERLQPAQPEVLRNRPQLRRPTRRPLPPMRAPVIPVGSAGAAPLGGSDGGGFQIALLLVPFVLALVDSARRSVRDITPPVARAYRSRRDRPG